MKSHIRKLIERNYKHGLCGTLVHRIWSGMKTRCNNKNTKSWINYGGRGITYCKEWENFVNFYNDMGNPPTNQHTLERIDNNKNYSKENCRWVTRKEQNRNSRNCRLITFKGKTKPISVWAEEYHLSYRVLYTRLYRGVSIKEALTFT